MNWTLIYEIVYALVVILVSLRVIYDTRDNSKTLAYLLLVIFLPIIGIIVYFSFGVNYRKNKLYSKKLFKDDGLAKRLEKEVHEYSNRVLSFGLHPVTEFEELARLLINDSLSALTSGNSVQILHNGEGKFPEVLKAIETAKDHIHIEYYIYEDDTIGGILADALIKKAREGITVRFIYDDFGSRSVRRKLSKRMKAAGIEVFPFHKIIFIALANRLNYRNHRKIVVIDGDVGFVGGINVSDRYINSGNSTGVYWRDTHLRIQGPGVYYLQYLFLCDWNFCAGTSLFPDRKFFPFNENPVGDNKIVQIAASGPDSDTPTILFSLLQVIGLAKREILITTPYFIPGENLLSALLIASLGGISVKLLVPGRSDSVFVNAAARSFYGDLLKANVEVYLYQKGFIHSKSMVVDGEIAMVGTANMDFRSFDLNFEVNAIVYDEEIARSLKETFYGDLKCSDKVDKAAWLNRPWPKKLLEKTARLFSPLL